MKVFLKKNYKIVILIFIVFLFSVPNEIRNKTFKIVTSRQFSEKETEIKKIKKKKTDLEKFLDKLGQMESGGSYTITNQYNYLGKYQMGRSALKAVGMEGVPDSIFLKTPELQEVAIRSLLKVNKRTLQYYINEYSGKTICGIPIDESSILASAQMAPGGTIQFLKSNGDSVFCDGNNTSIVKYFKKFYGYKLDLK